ncbi:hypothetical protein ANASTE_00746 [Anaerofustis stercorihominis DSM 17244]|uniref:Uncharacterized protein n=1 Tax=Anaerofustis stercorihominis DSM 17244 TaxID=445971 RepID=B1C7P3_9FIRM|nr:hypothetical protein ANASTE_00746 [Anaerofustis stercorihominis DSM 17244]
MNPLRQAFQPFHIFALAYKSPFDFKIYYKKLHLNIIILLFIIKYPYTLINYN